MATVGDGLLVGNQQFSGTEQFSGAAYLYSADGALMRTFLNPAPINGHFFGLSMAAVGEDKVLIGAPLGAFPGTGHPGAAYLYHTNGTLIRTFLRPPASQAMARFGSAVAALGSDRVLIGADGDDGVGTDSGAAYLFGTNGILLATFTNPAPQSFQYLGFALTAMGPDRVLVGAPHAPGAAFLFDTNGVMLTKFENPIPASGGTFGQTLAALGRDLVAIGAPGANIVEPGGGVVYLFQTNGVLYGPALENPDVTPHDGFGLSLAAVGSDRLLIGSYNQAAGQNAGAAYLFSTNGTVLMTIRNVSTNADLFGGATAAVTEDRVLIGARGADPAGAAYVYDLRPSLSISRTTTNSVVVSWASSWNGWSLQQGVGPNSNWNSISEPLHHSGTIKFIIANSPTEGRIYRLFKP